MTHAIPFDTLAFANKLKAAGIESKIAEAQAEAQAEVLANLINDNLATKEDLKDTEHRLLIRITGLVLGSVGALAALVSFLHVH